MWIIRRSGADRSCLTPQGGTVGEALGDGEGAARLCHLAGELSLL
jgi:hypothetical protein